MDHAPVPTNAFKARLAAGPPQYGLFSGLADPIAAEILAGSGFDWMMIDAEHSPNDLRTILAQLQATEPYDTHIVVRPEVGATVGIKRLLDIGVQSLLVPMVESAEQAEMLAAAVRYPPAGVRGVGTSLARAARWNRVAGYAEHADEQVCLITQIESLAGLAAIETIAAVDGVDALFVGPSDLAASMGLIGQTRHADVVAAVDDAIARIVRSGKPAGVFATTPDAAERWVTAGATFVAVGVDIALLASAAESLATSFRPERDD